MPPAIETKNLRKYFRPSGYKDFFFGRRQIVEALKGVSLSIERGELFGILGSNGAGKTTLLKILNMLVIPNSGEAFINGFNIYRDQKKIKRFIGYVNSEERSFFWRLSGKQNLFFFSSLYNLSSKQAKSRISDLVELLELQEVMDKPFMSYSTGLKQRFAIARGLLCDPEILFMDEPTRSLDLPSKVRIQHFVKEKLVHEQGRTVFLATHDLLEAEYLCDRLAVISKGKISKIGKVSEIKEQLRQGKTVYLKLKNLEGKDFKGLSSIEGVSQLDILSSKNSVMVVSVELEAEDIIPKIINELVRKNISVISCMSKEASLKDLFKQAVCPKILEN